MDTFEKRSINTRSISKGKVNSIKDGGRRRSKSSFLSDYFLVITFIFAVFLVVWSSRFQHHGGLSTNHTEMMRMKASFVSAPSKTSRKRIPNQHDHRLAGLNCEKWGGPSLEAAQEMVYWEDIPSDASFVSPFCREGEEKFMTFEPDGGGWSKFHYTSKWI